jgi:hypothetical protein
MSVWTEHGDDEAAEGRLRQRLGEDEVREGVGIGAAVVGRIGDAEQAGIAELRQHIARREAGILPGQRERLDLTGQEAHHLLAQQLVLGGRVDVVHAPIS